MLKRAAAALVGASVMACVGAAAPEPIAPFSAAQPGSRLPPGWSILPLPRKKPPEFTLVDDGGVTVLHVRSESAVGSAVHRMRVDPHAVSRLTWRWKVDHALANAALGTREGDDFAARVYVSFDVPEESLSFASRAKLKIARFIYGPDTPAAAICYVWDNRHPVGTTLWSPFSDRLRMVVLESGNARAGEWVTESRDIDADFRAAFAATWKAPAPAITGVAVAADTDQTLESVNAWFGDLRLEERR